MFGLNSFGNWRETSLASLRILLCGGVPLLFQRINKMWALGWKVVRPVVLYGMVPLVVTVGLMDEAAPRLV